MAKINAHAELSEICKRRIIKKRRHNGNAACRYAQAQKEHEKPNTRFIYFVNIINFEIMKFDKDDNFVLSHKVFYFLNCLHTKSIIYIYVCVCVCVYIYI